MLHLTTAPYLTHRHYAAVRSCIKNELTIRGMKSLIIYSWRLKNFAGNLKKKFEIPLKQYFHTYSFYT